MSSRRLKASWLGLLVILLALALMLVRVRMPSLRPTPPTGQPIRDLESTMPLNQPGNEPAPEDAYEVYSALYQQPIAEPLAFAENSWTEIPQVGESCLKPGTREEREMADAFSAANRQSHRWQEKFSIPQGYRLLSTQEVRQARACLPAGERPAAQCAPYKNLHYVRLLGVPGFDQAHSHALVSVVKSCGGFCGSGGIFEVVRAGGTWQRAEVTSFTRDCSWIY
jgi:hypothetical protein